MDLSINPPACILTDDRTLAAICAMLDHQAYPFLRHDVASLISDRFVPLILIKEKICRILKPKLVQDGFNVLNGESVPSTGRQNDFPLHDWAVVYRRAFHGTDGDVQQKNAAAFSE